MTDLANYYDESYPPTLWEPPAPPPAATGAVAGTPGTWLPPGSTPPASPGAPMTGITATPTAAWSAGQYVQTATAGAPGEVTWTGTGWVGGRAPVEEPAAPQAAQAPEGGEPT